MEHITLGDIQNVLVFFASVFSAGGVIVGFTLKRVRKITEEVLKPTNDKIDAISKKVDQVDIDNCKNYLQQAISALDAGETMDSAAEQRFYENYDHYCNDLHLNSWVHREVDRLEKEGKLKR